MMAEQQVLVHSHDPLLVVLSVLISILAAYAARALAERLRAAQGRAWLGWLLGGSLTIEAIPSGGARLTLALPLRSGDAYEQEDDV